MSLFPSYIDRLKPLWKELADVNDDIKEARREGRTTSVDRLVDERKKINLDIDKIMQEAKGNGFDPKVVEIVGRETLETDKQREKRLEFEIVLAMYRKELGTDRPVR